MQLTESLEYAVQSRPAHEATIFGARTRTWAQVADRVLRLAGGLRSAGVAPGDRVAVLALNSDRYIELYYAIAWAGAVIVPLNTRWAVPENVYALGDAASTTLLVDDEFLDQVPALREQSGVRVVVYMGEGDVPKGTLGYETLVANSQPIPNACGSDDDLYGIFYTGGTTGFPKGVMLSHDNFVFAAVSWIASLPLDEDTRYLHAAGLFHLGGGAPVVAVTLAAATHVIIPRFEPMSAFEAISRHRCTYLMLIPTMVGLMIHHPDCTKYDLTSVRTCQYGGSSMPVALLAAAMEKLPTWRFTQTYGLTETTAVTLVNPWKYHFEVDGRASKRASAGRASCGQIVRILSSADGGELPRGQVGEIAVRGPQVLLGYWRKPEATTDAIRDGWFHTGDLGWMDEDGFVYVVDRAKDMIVSGGENVYSREVESAIYQHPAVRECAVIGIPDERWIEAVHAVVAFREGQTATAQEIIDHCHRLIAGYKCPRSVEIRDSLPISAAGKLMKGSLRDPWWKDRRA